VQALNIDDEGRLLVHGESGEYAVAAGDVVHVRPVVPPQP
jgi:BirA family biotin operon repressor/biotin-[acetyl-CoA-carboxylase] ligase